MKRILYLGGFEMPDRNAAAQRVLANAMTLRELGYDVKFIGPIKEGNTVVEEFNGFQCEYIQYPQGLKQWIHYITTFVSIDKILSYQPEAVILYNFPSVASLKILKACRTYGIKVFHDLTEWESAPGWSPREIIRKLDINLRMRYCMKRMDGVIAISRYLYEYYGRYTKVILVPPTVDLTNSKFNRERKLMASTPVKLVFAGVVGFGVKESLDKVIDAVKEFNSVVLDIVGVTKERYEQVYGSLNIPYNNIRFHGRVSHTEAVKAVCNADFQMIIRKNTLKNKAGFPTKFVESMSCCTPLIATKSSNIGDYLQDGVNGFIVDDSHSLQNVLSRVSVMSLEEIVRMKENCRQFNGFDYRSFKEDFEKILHHG